MINLSTLLIYAALYVNFTFQSLALQAGLGYTALAAGAIRIPVGILLTLLSTRVGTLAGRYGARRFLTVGPVLMALGLLWYVRLPASSTPWRRVVHRSGDAGPAARRRSSTCCPRVILFGTGIALVVAPLTATLMGSVPGARSRRPRRR